jgi:hypothetical protein
MSPTTSALVGMSFNFIITIVLAGILAKFLPLAKTQAQQSASSVGNLIVHAVNTQVDPSLRAFVLAELHSLTTQVQTESQTALQTSLSVLEKALPSIPTATLNQVSQIVSEFVMTFESGLAASFATAVATAHSGAAVAQTPTTTNTASISTTTTTTTKDL